MPKPLEGSPVAFASPTSWIFTTFLGLIGCASPTLVVDASASATPAPQPRVSPPFRCLEQTIESQGLHEKRRLYLDARDKIVGEVKTREEMKWEAVYCRDGEGRLTQRIGSGDQKSDVLFTYGVHGELRTRTDFASGQRRRLLFLWRGTFFSVQSRSGFSSGGGATSPMANDALPEDLTDGQWGNPMQPLGFTGEVVVRSLDSQSNERYTYDKGRLQDRVGRAREAVYQWDANGRLVRSAWTERVFGRVEAWEALHRYDDGGRDVSTRRQGTDAEYIGIRFDANNLPVEGRLGGIVTERSTWKPCETGWEIQFPTTSGCP